MEGSELLVVLVVCCVVFDREGVSEVHADEVDARSTLLVMPVRLFPQRVGRSGAIVCVKTDLEREGDAAMERPEPPNVLFGEYDRMKCLDCI